MYVDEYEIIRPDDFVVKTVANKSASKVYIIQSIDRRMDLEDIASARGMDMNDLLTEIEAIVASGTKLNLDYYINANLDEEVVSEIYDYFRSEASSDSVSEAIKEIGSDYSDEEIRLVRIKFLCEVAN
jgi:ATP-dependent DNA helicase RecQ